MHACTKSTKWGRVLSGLRAHGTARSLAFRLDYSEIGVIPNVNVHTFAFETPSLNRVHVVGYPARTQRLVVPALLIHPGPPYHFGDVGFLCAPGLTVQ
jgi:hypothetical protein